MISLLDVTCTFDTVHAGHTDVEQHQINGRGFQRRQRMDAVFCLADDFQRYLARAIGQYLAQPATGRGFIVNDKDA